MYVQIYHLIHKIRKVTGIKQAKPGDWENALLLHFADDILKCIFSNENVWISIRVGLTLPQRRYCRPNVGATLGEPSLLRTDVGPTLIIVWVVTYHNLSVKFQRSHLMYSWVLITPVANRMTYVLARRQSNMTMLHNATNIITMPAENTYIIEKKNIWSLPDHSVEWFIRDISLSIIICRLKVGCQINQRGLTLFRVGHGSDVRAEFIWINIGIYLHFPPFLDAEMAQLVEILHHVIQGPTYLTMAMS